MLILHVPLVSIQLSRSNTWILEVTILILLSFSAKGPKRITLKKDLEQQQNLLKHCIENLKLFEASRLALISQLKEALHEQVLVRPLCSISVCLQL
jgi:hypothetical protein